MSKHCRVCLGNTGAAQPNSNEFQKQGKYLKNLSEKKKMEQVKFCWVENENDQCEENMFIECVDFFFIIIQDFISDVVMNVILR